MILVSGGAPLPLMPPMPAPAMPATTTYIPTSRGASGTAEERDINTANYIE